MSDKDKNTLQFPHTSVCECRSAAFLVFTTTSELLQLLFGQPCQPRKYYTVLLSLADVSTPQNCCSSVDFTPKTEALRYERLTLPSMRQWRWDKVRQLLNKTVWMRGRSDHTSFSLSAPDETAECRAANVRSGRRRPAIQPPCDKGKERNKYTFVRGYVHPKKHKSQRERFRKNKNNRNWHGWENRNRRQRNLTTI